MTKKFLLSLLVLSTHSALADTPRPTDRWKISTSTNNGQYIGAPINIQNVLPTLSEDGFVVGEASIKVVNDGKGLLVDQESTRLVGYWQNYDIGQGHFVRYEQPGLDAVAINVIQQESPSMILGNLSCSAACWLVNPNGIYFGENATVDTRGFMAAAMELNGLPMSLREAALDEDGVFNQDLFDSEVLKIHAKFGDETVSLFSDIDNGEPFLVNAKSFIEGSEAGDARVDNSPEIFYEKVIDDNGNEVPRVIISESGEYVYEGVDEEGNVKAAIEPNLPRVLVKKGATINSDQAPALLAGPEVINEGDINSEKGQVVLAGTRGDLYLALTRPDSESLRGFIVEVNSKSQEDGYGGAVVNAGQITANMGNVTLVASEVVQAGVIKSTTAVDMGGSIRIFARDGAELRKGSDNEAAFKSQLFFEDSNKNYITNTDSLLPAAQRGGDLDIRSSGQLIVTPDRTINKEKLLKKIDELTAADRDLVYMFAGVFDRTALEEKINQNDFNAEQLIADSVKIGALKESDIFEVMNTASDAAARSSEVVRREYDFNIPGDEKRQPNSQIYLDGQSVFIHGENQADDERVDVAQSSDANQLDNSVEDACNLGSACIFAPGGDIRVRARSDSFPVQVLQSVNPNVEIKIGQGAVIDASGSDDTVVSSDRNNLEFFLTSNEFKDAPIQKSGALLRETVYIDVRKGTELFDWRTGFSGIQKSANERASVGGNISLTSTGSLEVDNNVKLDASGGAVVYEEGVVLESRVLGPNGVVPISKASPEQIYSGVAVNTHTEILDPKWGKVKVRRPGPANAGSTRSGYTEGQDAGSITLSAPRQKLAENMVLDLGAELGEFQLNPILGSEPNATAGRLNLFANITPINLSPLDIVINDNIEALESEDDDSRIQITGSVLEKASAANIDIRGASDLLQNADLEFLEATNIRLTARGDLAIQGDIRTVGGSVNFNQAEASINEDGEFNGALHLNSTIDTSGGWLNYRQNADLSNTHYRIDAGNIVAASRGAVYVYDDAVLKADAGAAYRNSKGLEIGKAGDIVVAASSFFDPASYSAEGSLFNKTLNAISSDSENAVATHIEFSEAFKVSALDGSAGGSFSLLGPGMLLSNQANSNQANGGASDLQLVVDDEFLNNISVGDLTLVALNGGLSVEDGTHINFESQSLMARNGIASIASSANSGQVLKAGTLPDHLQSGSTLSLLATKPDTADERNGKLSIGENSFIEFSAQSTLNLYGHEQIYFDGALTSKGGTLNALLEKGPITNYSNSNYIVFGQNTNVDLSATSYQAPKDPQTGEQSARLIDAGSVSIRSENRHALVLEGAQFDLSGGAADLTQRIPSRGGSAPVRDIAVPLNAGRFSLVSEMVAVFAGDINFGSHDGEAHEGKAYAGKKGSLNFFVDPYANGSPFNSQNSYNPKPLTELHLTNSVGNLLADFEFGDVLPEALVDEQVTKANAYISFEHLDLTQVSDITLNIDNAVNIGSTVHKRNSILFDDSMQLSVSNSLVINTPLVNLNNHSVEFGAAHVQLGETYEHPAGQVTLTSEQLSLGEGDVLINADLIDLYGDVTFNNTAQIGFVADGAVRYRSTRTNSGESPRTNVSDPIRAENKLVTLGNLSIAAPVIYGESFSNFTFELGGENSFFEYGALGSQTSPIYSAHAKLAVEAKDISINGTIHNPFGSINLNAEDNLTLGDSAVLNVSGAGLTVPLGRLEAGDITWRYDTGTTLPARFEFDQALLQAKTIELKADNIETSDLSVVDLSAGGEIYGREFVPGLGGSRDFLAESGFSEGFVIVPDHNSGYAPFDVNEFFPTGSQADDTVPWGARFEISGSGLIAEGTYTVLPANYALLPGALYVTPEQGMERVGKGYTNQSPYGAEIVSGRMVDASGFLPPTWSAYRVETQDAVRARARYDITSLDSFQAFQNFQPGFKPSENGRLNIQAGQVLNLVSQVNYDFDADVGMSLDISAPLSEIVVTGFENRELYPDALIVDSALFENLTADSVLIGGERSWGGNAWLASPSATGVIVDGADVSANEVVLTATSDIRLINEASVTAPKSDVNSIGNVWVPDFGTRGRGALVLASQSDQSKLDISTLDRVSGGLSIDDTSEVTANNALAFVYDGNSSLFNFGYGDSESGNKRLQIYSEELTLGLSETTSVANGTETEIETLNTPKIAPDLIEQADFVELAARRGIGFDVSTNLNLTALSLRAPELNVSENSSVDIQIKEDFELFSVNPNPPFDGVGDFNPEDTSSLTISAKNIHLDGLDNQDSYFSAGTGSFELSASSSVLTKGNLNLNSAGNISISAPIIAARGQSKFKVFSSGDLSILRPLESENTVADLQVRPGAIFSFESGGAIDFNSSLSAKSGLVKFIAGDGITLGESTNIDLSPFILELPNDGETLVSPAGVFSLESEGDIELAALPGIIFNTWDESGERVEASEGGGLYVDTQSSILLGEWEESDVESKFDGVDFILAKGHSDEDFLTQISNLLQSNQIDDFSLVVAEGDINFAANPLSAQSIKLHAKQGGIVLGGNVEVTSQQGFNARAENRITLLEGVSLNDSYAAEDGKGISLTSYSDLVEFNEGASLDTNNGLNITLGMDAIESIPGGEFLLRENNLSAGAKENLSISLSSTLVFDGDANIDNLFVVTSNANTELNRFIDLKESGIESQLEGENLAVTMFSPHLRIQSSGDIQLNSELDFSANATIKDLAGTFELDAYGDIRIEANLSSGIESIEGIAAENFSPIALSENNSWSFALGGENITLSSAFVRSGTGDISINASADLQFQGNSYVASFGKTLYTIESSGPFIDKLVPLVALDEEQDALSYFNAQVVNGEFFGFSHQAGSIDISAGNKIQADSKSQSALQFMQRIATSDELVAINSDLSLKGLDAYYASVKALKGGIHSIGGDVSVFSKGGIENIGVSSPGQHYRFGTEESGGPKSLHSISGGDVKITSLGAISNLSAGSDGGSILVRSLANIGARGESTSGESLDKAGLLLTGSDFNAQVFSEQNMVIEGIINSFIAPSASRNPLIRSSASRNEFVSRLYFKDYEKSSVDFNVISGDFIFNPDAALVTKEYLPATSFYEREAISETMLQIAPSQLGVVTFGGDIRLDEKVMIFPDKNAHFGLVSSNAIYAKNIANSGFSAMVIPDLLASEFPSIDNTTSEGLRGVLDDKVTDLLGTVTVGQVAQAENRVHAESVIDRSQALASRVYSLNGDLGGDRYLLFRTPNKLDVFSAQDINNVGFDIQHGDRSLVSSIVAKGDIYFPFRVVHGNAFGGTEDNQKAFKFSGPGDFIVQAGGNINLGRSNGIVSIGGLENSALQSLEGGNLHIYAGVSSLGDFSRLLGSANLAEAGIPGLSVLGLDETSDTQTWFDAYSQYLISIVSQGGNQSQYADYEPFYKKIAILSSQVSKATGETYFSVYSNNQAWSSLRQGEKRRIAEAAMTHALADWNSYRSENVDLAGEDEALLPLRIAVSAMSAIAMDDPSFMAAGGEKLFRPLNIGESGFASQQERTEVFNKYWSGVGQLLTLQYLLTPERIADLSRANSEFNLSEFLSLPLAQQLSLAAETFTSAEYSDLKKQLTAEFILDAHMRQSSVEGANDANRLFSFERGYVAQQQFFGDAYQSVLSGMSEKAAAINSGEVPDVDTLAFGEHNGIALTSFDEVLQAWQADSSSEFTLASNSVDRAANIESIFTTIQASEFGGSVSLYAPNGSVDVGVSQAQVETIAGSRNNDQLGVMAKGFGDVVGFVAEDFNVNESRTFALAGGAINLWSAYGDVDAGKGAKTVVETPFPSFNYSNTNGRISIVRPPEVSGSGITTKESRSATGETPSATQRFYSLAEGAGPIYLSTPLGIVDAGEAGIQSAGDLFIAASAVVGADNISVGGASVGVAADTTVGGDVAAASDSTSKLTEDVQKSVSEKQEDEESLQAFVTVELLSTGTSRVRTDDPAREEDENDEDQDSEN